MRKYTFPKDEKLTSEKVIQELFEKGSSFYLFPFKVFYMANPDPAYSLHQVLISVSKKNFKRAVDRNLIKRRMRESFRLQKESLPESPKIWIGYIYSHHEILKQDDMKKKMLQTFTRLSKISGAA